MLIVEHERNGGLRKYTVNFALGLHVEYADFECRRVDAQMEPLHSTRDPRRVRRYHIGAGEAEREEQRPRKRRGSCRRHGGDVLALWWRWTVDNDESFQSPPANSVGPPFDGK